MYSKAHRACCLWLLLWAGASFAVPAENEKAQALFEQFFEERVSLSPTYQARLGRKTRSHEWDDISPAQTEIYHQLYRDQLHRLKQLDASELNEDNQLNVELMHYELEQSIDSFRWRDHNYPVNQMFGLHAGVPAFLINTHRISDIADAEAYVARLQGVGKLIDQLIANLERRANKGIVAPKFVYPYVLDDSRNVITGKPFSVGEASPLWADFTRKLDALELADNERQPLLAAAQKALLQNVEPAYLRLITALQGLEEMADDRAGIWKLPDGEAFYRQALSNTTTTELSADEIHAIGLAEVASIHQQMRELMASIGYEGSLAEFFMFTRDDKQFYYPDSEAGRAQYLADTQAVIDAMRERLPELFGHLPKAALEVKAVEPFREKSAGKAFYQSPAEDGSRPGIYYVNLHDMSAMPRYQIEALAYHEALPGHHMQIAIAQEMDNLPSFRRYGHYTAYIEGWGLYAERVPKEMGFYADPYSDFGRLSMELWRAIRLVVDTGLHHKKWTREQAIDYFVENSPMTRADATREIERYIVMPAQATAYKIGMNKLLELRAQAQQTLGEQFELRAFHDQVLGGGALPLIILQRQIEQWVAEQQPATSSLE
ncbi:MAG TPA: DUF885 domain-containing protein [Cellvibrionaceae bacterium]